MNNWTSTTHSIADIKEWADNNKLIIQPTYQRNTVWNMAAKVMLIDSILNNIPIPKIFLAKSLSNEQKPIRRVIDGQQRLTAILGFLRDEFTLEPPYSGDFERLKFSELSKEAQHHILQYNIDINEFTNPSEKQEREIYARINKYTIPLNAQELRQAEFPGDFLALSRKISSLEFWDNYKFFTPSALKRNLDVEFISETLILLIDGIQDKKAMLDDYYCRYMKMSNKNKIFSEYEEILSEIQILFDQILEYDGEYILYYNEARNEEVKKPLKRIRFSQQADFYSLFNAIKELRVTGGTLIGKNIDALVEDFVILDRYIAPESNIPKLKAYAVKCISQANAASSRRWRSNFLKDILNGTIKAYSISDDYITNACEINYNEITGRYLDYEGFEWGCDSTIEKEDPITGESFDIDKGDFYIGWEKEYNVYQISNIKMYKTKPTNGEYILRFINKSFDVVSAENL